MLARLVGSTTIIIIRTVPTRTGTQYVDDDDYNGGECNVVAGGGGGGVC